MVYAVVWLVGSALFFFLEGGFKSLTAYLAVAFFALLLFLLAHFLDSSLPRFLRLPAAGAVALMFGAGLMGYLQIVERFSEEEIYVFVQVILLSVWWALVWISRRLIARHTGQVNDQIWDVKRVWLVVPAVVSICLSGWLVLEQYQASFFPSQAPQYPGISQDQPFLCGKTADEPSTSYDGTLVLEGLLERIVANPDRLPPDLGMLALTTADGYWKEAFRQSLLEDAQRENYTGPAGSVKFGQYEAALRAYYFYEITQADPTLFSAEEQEMVRSWLSAVNERSLTVEWVDWMYSAAFGEFPSGPYLNQENGASLLALLEKYDYANPALREENRKFLQKHAFGWKTHFRNTDDSILYQSLWLHNALFQSIFTGDAPPAQVKKSLEWLLLQALPDGAPFGYNPDKVSLAGSAYLGAQLSQDGRFLWLAGRAVGYAQQENLSLRMQPGISGSLDFSSEMPTDGSCLIYGDSGTPVLQGPLAPDKIVFRDGWQLDDMYLNLNLRFTGWHRYKATNSVITIYQDGPIIVEQSIAPRIRWLPIGRSIFRDKRIPRENLNGLLIQKQGISRFVYRLTGFGSIWAQDPSFYARVEQFTTGPDMDQSVTVLDWNGWQHYRYIYFIHDGPLVIIDKANGPSNENAAVVWHGVIPNSLTTYENGHISLGKNGQVEMHIIPLAEGVISQTPEMNGDDSSVKMQFTTLGEGKLMLATVFLPKGTHEAQIQTLQNSLLIDLPSRQLTIPLPTEGGQ